MFQAALAIPRTEGVAALYKGFEPIVYRKIIWCTVFFLGFEKLMVVLAR